MIFKRTTFHIAKENAVEFIDYLNNYKCPIYIRNGARLIGQWTNATNTEIMCIWEYPNLEEFKKINKKIEKEEAQHKEKQKTPPFHHYEDDLLTSTATFIPPKHSVTVSGLITNVKQEVLLVKTYWRSDTWELPGGGVDEGETLDRALFREILEETGVQVKLTGVSGVYSNGSNVCVVFRGEHLDGNLSCSNETMNVSFIELNPSNLHKYIKRPKFKSRVLDALKGNSIPFEAFKVRPYELISRLDANKEM